MIRPSLVPVALLACCGPLAAQSGRRECRAEPSFHTGLWQYGPGADSASTSRMQARLARRFTLLVIASEGAGVGKLATESEITIWPSTASDTAPRIGRARDIVGYGRSVVLRNGYLHHGVDRIAPGQRPRFFRVQFRPPDELTLTWVADSTSLDHMGFDGTDPTLEVHRIADEVMTGRWLGGGFEVLPASTPVGILVEAESGYFCAWPR